MEAKQFVFPSCLVHLLACLVLLSMAIYRATRPGQATSVPGSLLPFLIVAGITGIMTAGLALLHWTFHNGMMIDAQMLKMRFGGPYWWVYLGILVLPLLPLTGFFPPIARCPWLVAGFAFVAILGSTFLLTLF